MTVRIEAGKIYKNVHGGFKRYLVITDCGIDIFRKYINADTIGELEIVDHENFMKE